jgi:hypothetical protein
VVLRAIGVVPETDRHHREGPRANELTFLRVQRPAVVVEHVARHAQAAALDLAAANRLQRVAEDEAQGDVA